MFSESNNLFRDILLLAAGCLGIFWFYYNYKSVEPLSVIKNSVLKETVISRSDSVISSWQVYYGEVTSKSEMRSYRGIIDSLQHQLGSTGFHDLMKDGKTKNFPLFYWKVDNFFKETYYTGRERVAEVLATPSGEIFSYSMNSEAIKKIQPYNNNVIRKALGLNFEPTVENRAIQDSLLNKLLRFQSNAEDNYRTYTQIQKFSKILGASIKDGEEVFTQDKIWSGVSEYLNDSYWKRYSFHRDSLKFEQEQGLRFVRLFLTSQDSVLGFLPKLEIDLLPAGGIKAITFNMVDIDIPPRPYSDVITVILQFTFLCLGIWLISIFYLRIKAKAIDTQPAFVISVLAGSIIFAVCIAGILIGLWTIMIQIFPGTHSTADIKFQSSVLVFPSLGVMLENLLGSLLVVITVLMILGNQLYSITKAKWVIPLLSGFIFALLLESFISLTIHPFNLSLIINFIIGAVFGAFYIRYGFLSMVLSLFIFTGFFSTRAGWVLSNSPDANLFYIFVAIIVAFLFFGFYFVTTGSEKKDLPDYVPGYIEDQAKEQRLDQELEIAQSVQRAFLPSRVAQLPGIDIAGICEPAQETGGDYYDMIPLGKNRMAIAIGDVSGKGIQAAFYMTFVKGVLHSLSALILSPLELLNQLNRLFKENATRGTFVSMIYGILEADKRTFTFARAGHNPMLVVRANGDAEWLQSKGIGIGVTNSLLFIKGTEERELKLKEGDVAILYTDGITEMHNISNQFYGEERLKKVVKGVRKGTSSKILDIIISDVTEFKGVAKQHDDMTLVVMKADASVNK